jgi:phage protein D/phage baseplate assembly protein gpV
MLEKKSLETKNFYLPRFEVEIDNKKLPPEVAQSILDITVEEEINEGAHFQITVNIEFDLATHEFKWLDDSLFNPGNTIKIKMGYENVLHDMLTGKITSLEPRFFSGENPSLIVRGHDLSYDYFKKPSPEKPFVEMKYSDIIQSIASDAQLKPVVDNTEKYETLITKTNDETYYVFLEKLANKVGYQLKIDNKTLYFTKYENDTDAIFTLELGTDIISFSPSFNTTGLITEVEVRGYNPQDPSKPIVGTAKAGDEGSQESGKKTASQVAEQLYGTVKKVISNAAVNSEEQAKKMAQSILSKASESLIEGNVKCIGIPEIRAGVNVMIEKAGKIFSGKYYVKSVTHTINNSGYLTSFSVGAKTNTLYDAMGSKQDKTGSISGVMPGTVTNNQDPEELGRIKIKFYVESEDNETGWVSIATPMAGAQRGMFFLPEVGDEVLVAFENGDINRPYVIGALWSGKAAPPETNSDGKNNIRKICSRSGHEIIFNDDSENSQENIEIHSKSGHTILLDDTSDKGKIEIKTSAEHKIVLDDTSGKEKIEITDKDGSNKIIIDSAGGSISMESSKITIKADTVEIHSGSSLTLKSDSDLTVKGSTVKIN